MKKLFIFISMILPCLLCSTVIPAGDVSGLWDLTGSPYYIDGEITIQSGEELVIEPGVDVIFNGHYKFFIYGRIVANGTETDSIRFMPIDSNTGWHSLRFIDGNLSSLPCNEISYCEFWQGFALGDGDERSGGAVFCSNTGNLGISNSSFYENYAQLDGGAIYLEAGSDIEIDNCLFQLNNCGFYGGGMIAYDSDPVLNGCVFFDNNSAVFAAGFSSWDQSNPELYNCTFIDNTAGACTGIYCVSSTVKMANVLFRGNITSFGSGAACGLTNCATDVSNITAVDNTSPLSGGAFWVNGGTLNLYNSILWNNLPENIFVLSGAGNAFNSCISDGYTGPGVISDNPQFLNYAGGDYHLAEISPCIDTGDESLVTFPLPEYDLDGNIRIVDGDNNGTATIDMGVYEFTPEAPNGFIAGTVTDGEGSFLENAEITAGEYTTITDANGEYEIEIATGDYTVTCYLEGYEVPDGVEVTVIAGETVYIDFILTEVVTTGIISGVVTDIDGGFLENAQISAGEYTTTTNVNGEYAIVVEAGDYTVTCYLEGYEVPDEVEVTVITGETVYVDFILELEVDADDPLSDVALLLLGNYPNPFNPSTTIRFQLPSGCEQAEITIYNLRGQAIISYPVNSSTHQPVNSLTWDGKDADNQPMSSGLYFYEVRTGTESATGKMIMMK